MTCTSAHFCSLEVPGLGWEILPLAQSSIGTEEGRRSCPSQTHLLAWKPEERVAEDRAAIAQKRSQGRNLGAQKGAFWREQGASAHAGRQVRTQCALHFPIPTPPTKKSCWEHMTVATRAGPGKSITRQQRTQ